MISRFSSKTGDSFSLSVIILSLSSKIIFWALFLPIPEIRLKNSDLPWLIAEKIYSAEDKPIRERAALGPIPLIEMSISNKERSIFFKKP